MTVPHRRPLLLAGVAGLLLVLVAWFALAPERSVVVRDSDGTVVARVPLADSGRFEIEYSHSYYREPAVESFAAGGRGGFTLVAVSSPSEAVLDYYELEGDKEAAKGPDDPWMRLVPEERQRFEELPLIGTARGRKTLVVSGERTSLFKEDGPPAHLTLRVERGVSPRAPSGPRIWGDGLRGGR